jgi:hypothetical protein
MAFHVPEGSRDRTHPTLGSTAADGNNGAFHVPSPEPGWTLALICSDGTDDEVPEARGWEHVSVHAYRTHGKVVQMRTPTWREMTFVKDLCWDAEDVVIQYHPRKSEYVNNHPHVLHLWRPTHVAIPTPPPLLVGVLP